jgi:hypothetical protein
MSLYQRNQKRDANEQVIADALHAAGRKVELLSKYGLPDLLVYSPVLDRLLLLEVKSKNGRLTTAQVTGGTHGNVWAISMLSHYTLLVVEFTQS